MAAKGTLTIQHPNPKKVQTILTSTFPASGRADGTVGFITGEVKSSDGKTTYKGRTIQGGDPWTISFEDIPKGNGYTLTVKGSNADPQTATFNVDPKHAIGITYPKAADCPLCNTFTAYGFSDLPYPVSGQMTYSAVGGGVYFGNTLQGPPQSGTWFIQFQGVPDCAGSTYTLLVSDTEGNSNSSPNLIVDHHVCTPP